MKYKLKAEDKNVELCILILGYDKCLYMSIVFFLLVTYFTDMEEFLK